MENHETVLQIFDKINMPTGKETVYFPKWKGEPLQGHEDYKNGGFVARLDDWQTVDLGHMISEAVGKRYTALPAQKSYDLVHKDKNFKELMKRYWIHDREVILESGYVVPDPVVIESNGKLMLKENCRKIKVDIDESSVFKTLANAGLMKKPKKKVWDGGISFENGEASVRSHWNSDGGCFLALAYRPSGRSDGGVVALLKTDEQAEFSEKPKMREVAESEYQELLGIKKEHEALLKELAPVKKYF
jgi:hypothetical protein